MGGEVSQRGPILQHLTIPIGETDMQTAMAKLNEIRTALEK